MLVIRSDAGVSPALMASTNLTLHNVVVPALRRVLGADLILPPSIRLAAASHADGHVPGRVDTNTGEIVSVEEPIVCATERAERMRYVLVHEMAHYHELSLRKARGIRVLGKGPTQLWSEYFAQRVSWTSGLTTMETFRAGSDEDVVTGTRPPDSSSAAYSSAYMLTFVLAHADAVPSWLDAYPGKEDYLRTTVGILHEGGVADGLFQRFPDWNKADANLASKLFRGLLKIGRLCAK